MSNPNNVESKSMVAKWWATTKLAISQKAQEFGAYTADQCAQAVARVVGADALDKNSAKYHFLMAQGYAALAGGAEVEGVLNNFISWQAAANYHLREFINSFPAAEDQSISDFTAKLYESGKGKELLEAVTEELEAEGAAFSSQKGDDFIFEEGGKPEPLKAILTEENSAAENDTVPLYEEEEGAKFYFDARVKGIGTMNALSADFPLSCSVEGCKQSGTKAEQFFIVWDPIAKKWGVVCADHRDACKLLVKLHAEQEGGTGSEEMWSSEEERKEAMAKYREIMQNLAAAKHTKASVEEAHAEAAHKLQISSDADAEQRKAVEEGIVSPDSPVMQAVKKAVEDDKAAEAGLAETLSEAQASEKLAEEAHAEFSVQMGDHRMAELAASAEAPGNPDVLANKLDDVKTKNGDEGPKPRTRGAKEAKNAIFPDASPGQKCPCGKTNKHFKNHCGKGEFYNKNTGEVSSGSNSNLVRHWELPEKYRK